MMHYNRTNATRLLIGFLVTGYYFWGISLVPFHPDESTYIYMSADTDTLFTDPIDLAWDRSQEISPTIRYRLIDSPLTRYMIGVGRSLLGLSVLPADWDWSMTWAQNSLSGGLPAEDLLNAARFSVALVFPFSLLLIYASGRSIEGKWTAVLSIVFLAGNALVLLHTRRAMAESILLFSTLLWMYLAFKPKTSPLLLGLAAGLAFNSKQSGLSLLPLSMLALVWSPSGWEKNIKKLLRDVSILLAVFIFITAILNPVFWRQPLRSIQVSLQLRGDFNKRQSSDMALLNPEGLLESPGKRLLSLVANVYILPPSFAEVGNYLEQTRTSELAYLNIPGHNLFRGLVPGALLFTLTIVGIYLAFRHRSGQSPVQRRSFMLLFTATTVQAIFILSAFSLPWQRYYISLVPMLTIWIAYAISIMIQTIQTQLSKSNG